MKRDDIRATTTASGMIVSIFTLNLSAEANPLVDGKPPAKGIRTPKDKRNGGKCGTLRIWRMLVFPC